MVAVAALALTACAGGETDATGDPTDTMSPSTAPTSAETTAAATPSERPSTAANRGVPAMAGRCQLPSELPAIDLVEFAVPEGWQVQEGNCEFLDPALERIPEGTEPDAALGMRISDTAFSEIATSGGEIRDEVRHVGARSGYQAVRIRGESTGQGLRPEGQPVLLWLVDLDPGTDEDGGTLVMSASPSSGAEFDLAEKALDRVAETVRVVPAAAGEDVPVVVARSEGGGQPFAVTYDREAGCFRLHAGAPTDAPVDEACDLGSLADEDVVGAILRSGDLEVAAGLTSPLANRVSSDEVSAPYGGVTTSLEGASAFAYPALETPVEVRAVDAAGDVVATGTVG